MSLKKTLEKLLPEKWFRFIKGIYLYPSFALQPFPYREYMDQRRCIFVHIPKTAGTSILHTLMGDNIFRDHATWYDFQRVDSYRYEQFYKFCFVRNPYDRVVSAYEYLKRGGNGVADLYFQDLLAEKYPSFELFVTQFLTKDRIHEHVLFKPQYLFVYDHKDQCKVDFVGRFETLEKDFSVMCSELKINADLPKKNQVKRSSYQDYFEKQSLKDIVFDLYQRDFELFSYQK